jgi:hypothetical protein
MSLIHEIKMKIKRMFCLHNHISTKASFDDDSFESETSCKRCGKKFPAPERIKQDLDGWERNISKERKSDPA